ncbi:L,D-transpeptidase [Lactobacillus hamsteri]|uniref:L,D-transpeptidase n=1 Tax=Lactobacillus hamsteri TaxID=96565 RepID=UPI00054F543E|nr:L,D-transpeptidase [Lactobacillus hamsteri]
MNKKFKTILASVALATAFSVTAETQVSAATKTAVTKTSAKTKLKKTKYQPYADPADMRKMTGTYWKKSSQTKTKYPNLRKVKNLNLRVSILGNRVYVRSGNKVLYTMYCSAGKMVNGKSLTPRGTYRTNSYHPHRFSSAFYPVGWIGQLYLFHSVPTHEWSNTFIPKEAHKLGKKPASHGCVRLSVSDAKWLHDHVPYNTKVIIKYR